MVEEPSVRGCAVLYVTGLCTLPHIVYNIISVAQRSFRIGLFSIF